MTQYAASGEANDSADTRRTPKASRGPTVEELAHYHWYWSEGLGACLAALEAEPGTAGFTLEQKQAFNKGWIRAAWAYRWAAQQAHH